MHNLCKPDLNRDNEIEAVVDLRRGIDLLPSRADVDPKRLAYERSGDRTKSDVEIRRLLIPLKEGNVKNAKNTGLAQLG